MRVTAFGRCVGIGTLSCRVIYLIACLVACLSPVAFAQPATRRAGFDCDKVETATKVSIVGPFVSEKVSGNELCKGAASSTRWHYLIARDSNSGQRPVALPELFPEAEILTALLRDGEIGSLLPVGASPRSLKDLAEIACRDDCDYDFGNDWLTRFAFAGVEGSRVRVRIGLSHTMNANRGRIEFVDLLMTIPEKLKEHLEAARLGKQGFLMDHRPAQSGSATPKG
jgi:hypothetical protein